MIQLTINTKRQQFDGDPAMPLLWFLRDELLLTGTKFGCGMGLCGACTVHVDGEALRSCQTPMSAVAGKRVTTIEGLGSKGEPSAAARVEGQQRAAVRLLPERPDHAGGRDAQEDGQAERQRHRPPHGRQYLPMRHLPADSRRHQASRGGEVMITATNVSRRHFLGEVFSAGAFVVSARLLPVEAISQTAKPGALHTWEPSVYLGIEPTGAVKIIAHRSEMGTGARTCLPMIVADELEADWSRVTIVQALGDVKYGSQNTDGSCSVRDFYQALRTAGASARSTLEIAAAGKWGVPVEECRGQQHFVVHAKSGRKMSYGELVPLAAAATAPQQSALRFKTPKEFRYIGKDVPLTDLNDLVTGKGTFGIDARMPGHGVRLDRAPAGHGQHAQERGRLGRKESRRCAAGGDARNGDGAVRVQGARRSGRHREQLVGGAARAGTR